MPDITFTPVITAAGFAAALAAETGGFKINITHIATGSTGYVVPVNASGLATKTALTAEKDRVAIQSAIETAPGQTDISFVISSANEYFVREVGFFLSDGTLFAIAAHPTTALMWKSAQTQAAIAFELLLEAVNPASINIISAGPPLELLLTAERARLDALEAGRALKTTTLTGAGLATGGGNMSADLTISVPAATQLEAEAGVSTTKAMTPFATAKAILAQTAAMKALLQVAGLDPAAYPNEVNLNAIAGSGFFRFLSTAANAPTPGTGYDAAGIQIFASGQTLQMVSLTEDRPLLYRIKDAATWSSWYGIVDERREINTSGLATGGGNMSADLTISVPAATQLEAEAGVSSTKAMTPFATAKAILAQTAAMKALLQVAGLDPAAYPNETNLNAIAGSGFFRFLSSAANAPTPGTGYDAAGIQIFASGQTLQIVSLTDDRPLLYRIKDAATWGPWRNILHAASATSVSYASANAPDAWIISANVKGDTAITLGALSGRCIRLGNMAHMYLIFDVAAFSVPVSDDASVTLTLDLAALGVASGWFTSVTASSIGSATGEWTVVGADIPTVPFEVTANSTANTLFFQNLDTTILPTQASPATGLQLRLTISMLVGD